MSKIIHFPTPDPLMIIGGPEHAVRIFIAPTPRARKTFFNTTALRQPGFYIGIWRDSVYVGGATDVAQRTKTSEWRGGPPPDDCLIGIVSARGSWQDEDGFALERIAYSALFDGGAPLDQHVPRGAPVGLPRYADLQAMYAEAVQLLRLVMPRAAFAWQGPPNRLRDGDFVPVHERRVAGKLTATRKGPASIRREGDRRWIVETGSIIRLDATQSTGGINQVLREELTFAGILVPLPNGCYRLTRDILFTSRSKCSSFAHSARGAVDDWKLVTDADAQRLAHVELHPFPPKR